MPISYMQHYALVMEDGRIVLWSGKAEDKNHGEGLAIAYATEKTGLQVWDIASRPKPYHRPD